MYAMCVDQFVVKSSIHCFLPSCVKSRTNNSDRPSDTRTVEKFHHKISKVVTSSNSNLWFGPKIQICRI